MMGEKDFFPVFPEPKKGISWMIEQNGENEFASQYRPENYKLPEGRTSVFVPLDVELAKGYGGYATYPTTHDPIAVETYGDAPEDEMDRLLGVYTGPDTCVLDHGCGAGFTLCRLAPRVRHIWGFEQDEELFAAARQRVDEFQITNATLIQGNNSEPDEVDRLPNDTFDVAFSRRGPVLVSWLMPKLKQEAYFIQEYAEHILGFSEFLGIDAKAFLPHSQRTPDWFDGMYFDLGMLPVSTKNYYYERYYRDADHLEADLVYDRYGKPKEYRAGLDLYVRYNTTPKGVRVMCHKRVGVFRRASVEAFPAPNRG